MRIGGADGAVVTGGIAGTGGLGTGGPGSGGIVGSGGGSGPVGTGGFKATGGITGVGGSGSGGSVGVGGNQGGLGGSLTGGAGGTSALDANNTTACTCSAGTTSFDCFCTIHSCTLTLSYFTPDAGTGAAYATLEEYANCNLIVVDNSTSTPGATYVFDRTTGSMVGATSYSDVVERCPFGQDSSTFRSLSAGRFPDASCVRSNCVNGVNPARQKCTDAGS